MKKIIENGYTLEVGIDDCPRNPREDDGNLCLLCCAHQKHNLGDVQVKNFNDFTSWDEWLNDFKDHNNVWYAFPLYMIDHSSITLSLNKFSCPWDSGQLGYAIVTQEIIDSGCFQDPSDETAVRKAVEKEIEAYNSYVNGAVYQFTITNLNGDVMEACGGYCDEEKAEDDGKEALKSYVSI